MQLDGKYDYRNEIMYWQNRLNKAINCAPVDYTEANIKNALSCLTYFVNMQKEIDFPPAKESVNEWKPVKRRSQKESCK